MPKSIYLHIPFCEHICYYCDFNKVFLKKQPVDEYLSSMRTELSLLMETYQPNEIQTIFVGGGTPTSLNEKQLAFFCQSIRDILPYSNGEFTFEANPGDLSESKLRVLKEYGVNRISLGVQSFNEEMLKKIGRTHTPHDVFTSIEKAKNVGFDNISIDLIYSLPEQTLNDFQQTLQTALSLDLPHYSAYSLIIEPKTIFYNLIQKGKLALPPEETEARMYEWLMEEMDKNGIYQYEISNFARPGFESQHNLVYWNNEEYFGAGAGAHSYVQGVRRSNYGPLKKYMAPLEQRRFPIYTEHHVTKKEQMEEEMFLGLRKTKGVSIARFTERYGVSPLDCFSHVIEELIQKELIEVVQDTIRLTKEGKLLGNVVFQSFLGEI